MFFSYDQYFRGCLIIPLLTILFSLIAFIFVLISVVKNIRAGCFSLSRIFSSISIVSVIIFFILMSVGRLCDGGYYLALEGEADSVEIRGHIVKIESLGRFEFPELKSEYGYGEDNGVRFVIGDIQCSAPVSGNFAVGDYVIVVYLPRSGYVLSILPCGDFT